MAWRIFATLALLPLCAWAAEGVEFWDATTLDINQEQHSLAGTWDYVPWEDLNTVPDFHQGRPVHVPMAQMAGAYRTSFSVKGDPATSRVILDFGAVAFRCAVFVNGHPVGSHAGGMTPFEFDVTGEVHPGKDELVVIVLGEKGRALSAESTVSQHITYNERAQALVTGGGKTVLGGGTFPSEGIRQDVYVREVPLIRIADATITTSFRKKELSAEVPIINQSAEGKSLTVSFEVLLYALPERTVGEETVWKKTSTVEVPKGISLVQIRQAWPDPELWMPGDPHLYVARIRLLDRTGTLLNERYVRFGFREVWVEGRRIMVNGKPFRALVHGALDTEAKPEVTRAMFRQVMAAGVNMVRPHTRPPVESFAQIADEMGMAIIGESELTFNSNYAYDEPIFWSNFERLFRERISRDKNHPSILLWSLANEVIISSPGQEIGQHFYQAFQALRKVDPTRPFMQEGDGDLRDMREGAKGFPIDIVNLHPYDISSTKNPLWASEFPPVAWTLEKIKTPKEIPATNKFGDQLPDKTRPWFMGEFGLAGAGYPDVLSFWTGPEAYRDLFGQAGELFRSLGEITILQLQAFRDMDMAGMDPWDMPDKPVLAPYLRIGFEPVTTFARDRCGHWTGGKMANRRVITLNDSFVAKDLILTISLKDGEKELARKVEKFHLEPGARRETRWETILPVVRDRTPLEFSAQLTDETGSPLSGFHQDWLAYPPIQPIKEWGEGRIWLCGNEESFGQIANWSGVRPRPPAELNVLNRKAPMAVILDQSASDSVDEKIRGELDRFVRSGGILVYLGVKQVLGAPEALKSNPDSDSTRLFLLAKNPLVQDTTRRDWEFWQSDHMVSRGNYPMSFAPSFEFPLVGGGRNGPMYSPLAIWRKGEGAVIACRLELNETLPEEPMAAIFLNRLVSYGRDLKQQAACAESTAVLFCPSGEEETWRQRMEKAGIPFTFGNGDRPQPGEQVAFLCGDAILSPAQWENIGNFVAQGGKLWLHGLSPGTPCLEKLSSWLGQQPVLAPPKMWLQQLEVASPQVPSPMLNGVNDFLTCWATFGWTNGEMSKVCTTKIADYLMTMDSCPGEALLCEPGWLGRWKFGPGTYTLSQAIAREVGQHEQNRNPGLGLVVYRSGRGLILVDQMRWPEVMMDSSSESRDKARYLAGRLWKNLRDLATESPRLKGKL